jgi:hypothetical protein
VVWCEAWGLSLQELVWATKHADLGDAFFDRDAAAWLLRRLRNAAEGTSSGEQGSGLASPSGGDGGAAQRACGSSAGARSTPAAEAPHAAAGASTSPRRQGEAPLPPPPPSQQRQQQQPARHGPSAGPNWTRALELTQAASGSVGGGEGRGSLSGWRLVLEAGATVSRLEDRAEAPQAALAQGGAAHGCTLVLSNGRSVAVDLVVVAIGVAPVTDWLPAELQRAADGGLAVGPDMRSSDRDVWAAGEPSGRSPGGLAGWAHGKKASASFGQGQRRVCEGCARVAAAMACR